MSIARSEKLLFVDPRADLGLEDQYSLEGSIEGLEEDNTEKQVLTSTNFRRYLKLANKSRKNTKERDEFVAITKQLNALFNFYINKVKGPALQDKQGYRQKLLRSKFLAAYRQRVEQAILAAPFFETMKQATKLDDQPKLINKFKKEIAGYVEVAVEALSIFTPRYGIKRIPESVDMFTLSHLTTFDASYLDCPQVSQHLEKHQTEIVDIQDGYPGKHDLDKVRQRNPSVESLLDLSDYYRYLPTFSRDYQPVAESAHAYQQRGSTSSYLDEQQDNYDQSDLSANFSHAPSIHDGENKNDASLRQQDTNSNFFHAGSIHDGESKNDASLCQQDTSYSCSQVGSNVDANGENEIWVSEQDNLQQRLSFLPFLTEYAALPSWKRARSKLAAYATVNPTVLYTLLHDACSYKTNEEDDKRNIIHFLFSQTNIFTLLRNNEDEQASFLASAIDYYQKNYATKLLNGVKREDLVAPVEKEIPWSSKPFAEYRNIVIQKFSYQLATDPKVFDLLKKSLQIIPAAVRKKAPAKAAWVQLSVDLAKSNHKATLDLLDRRYSSTWVSSDVRNYLNSEQRVELIVASFKELPVDSSEALNRTVRSCNTEMQIKRLFQRRWFGLRQPDAYNLSRADLVTLLTKIDSPLLREKIMGNKVYLKKLFSQAGVEIDDDLIAINARQSKKGIETERFGARLLHKATEKNLTAVDVGSPLNSPFKAGRQSMAPQEQDDELVVQPAENVATKLAIAAISTLDTTHVSRSSLQKKPLDGTAASSFSVGSSSAAAPASASLDGLHDQSTVISHNHDESSLVGLSALENSKLANILPADSSLLLEEEHDASELQQNSASVSPRSGSRDGSGSGSAPSSPKLTPIVQSRSAISAPSTPRAEKSPVAVISSVGSSSAFVAQVLANAAPTSAMVVPPKAPSPPPMVVLPKAPSPSMSVDSNAQGGRASLLNAISSHHGTTMLRKVSKSDASAPAKVSKSDDSAPAAATSSIDFLKYKLLPRREAIQSSDDSLGSDFSPKKS